jgi:hypothetical protein
MTNKLNYAQWYVSELIGILLCLTEIKTQYIILTVIQFYMQKYEYFQCSTRAITVAWILVVWSELYLNCSENVLFHQIHFIWNLRYVFFHKNAALASLQTTKHDLEQDTHVHLHFVGPTSDWYKDLRTLLQVVRSVVSVRLSLLGHNQISPWLIWWPLCLKFLSVNAAVVGLYCRVANFQAFTVVSIQLVVFWTVALCRNVDGYRYSDGTCCSQLQGRNVEKACSSETSAST